MGKISPKWRLRNAAKRAKLRAEFEAGPVHAARFPDQRSEAESVLAPAVSTETGAGSIWDGFEQYARDNLKIVDKEGRLVPFELNSTQRSIMSAIRAEVDAGRPPRIICLKSRQVGVSTLAEALLFYACQTQANRNSLVIAHNDKATRTLFRIARRCHEHLPTDKRTKPKYRSVRELQFENDSRLQVETVGDIRGYTAQYAHLSELAFWGEGATEAFIAVMQTIPRSVDSLVIIESTANGVGGKFHSIWQRAVVRERDRGPNDERGWVPVFIPWFKHEEYQEKARFNSKMALPEERELFKRFPKDITLMKLQWRRGCIESNCDGDDVRFQVEFPTTAREAFLMSGRTVIDKDALEYYSMQVPPAVPSSGLPPQSEIEWDEKEQKAVIYQVDRGRLRIYEEPKERHSYIIGADPSEGDPGSDPSPLAVLDQQTLNFVAVWHGRIAPDELAKIAVWLGRYYGNYIIINEANNHGIAFHNQVMDMDGNLYFREAQSDSVAEQYTLKPGFLTTKRSKGGPVHTLRRYCREKARLYPMTRTRMIRDPIFVDEMHTYVWKKKPDERESRSEAESGHKDDVVTAGMLALWCHRGSKEAPLEPIPEIEIVRHSEEYQRLRERAGADEASRYSLDVLGMTGADFELALDAAQHRERARRRNGHGRMV